MKRSTKNKDTRAVEPLIAALKDANPQVRLHVAHALGGIKDTRAVEPLIVALKDENWEVRASMADALREIKDPRAVEPLIAALEDEDPNEDRRVKRSVIFALDAIGGERSERALDHLIPKDVNLKQIASDYPSFLNKRGEKGMELILTLALLRYGDLGMAQACLDSNHLWLTNAAFVWAQKNNVPVRHIYK